ncbi:MAG: ATP-dependent helicase HrpB [Planctomycetaceae bacterium]
MTLRPGALAGLPVADVLAEVVAASRPDAAGRGGSVVVTAPPGSGKTMLVPAAILDDLPRGARVDLLQPRRLAARSVAGQIARLRGGEVGGEVGYHVRFDARVGPATRLVVQTTGIMLRRLLDDVELAGTGCVVLDEFHERSVEMDLVLGMLVRIRATLRPDLRIAVMSATLEPGPVARLLAPHAAHGCPVVSTAGRLHPVAVSYGRRGDGRDLDERVVEAVGEAVARTTGHVLVFLPGVGEIMRAASALDPLADRRGLSVVILHGELPPELQDRALEDDGTRKIVLATNVAETSLTIPGVTAVVDSGLARQSRLSPATGLPRLELVPISKAAADQRAGRAGRTGPGQCLRLWDEAAHHHRPAAETPEVLRTDLAPPLLTLLALGEADAFPWLDAPPADALAQAHALLAMLGAADTARDRPRITDAGRELARLPTHPRLARLLLAGARLGVLREAAVAAALLSERDPFRTAAHARPGPRDRTTARTRSDVVDRVLALQAFHATGDTAAAGPWGHLDLHPGGARTVLRAAEQLFRLVEADRAPRAADPAAALARALLEAFPDRLARLRPGSTDRATMAGGRGLRLDGGSRVRAEPLFLAVDLDDAGGEARVRQASAVERAWLDEDGPRGNLATRDELLFNPSRRQVESRRRTCWLDLVLEEAPAAIADPAAAAALLAEHAARDPARVLPEADSAAGRFRARVAWLSATLPELGLPSLADAALVAMLPALCHGVRGLDDLRAADWLSLLRDALDPEKLPLVERLAPAEVEIAGGRRVRLDYRPDAPPILAARIQDLFGTLETPRIAGGRVPVLVHLLGPNHRPQQVTSDLASFWKTTYHEVRKELRRRYPKHSWPEDPLTARPPAKGDRRGTTG